MAKSVSKVFDNKFAIFIIILIIIGLFLHYEMDYKFDLFTIGGRRGRGGRRNRWHQHHAWPWNWHRSYISVSTHDPTIQDKYLNLKTHHSALHHSGPNNPKTTGYVHDESSLTTVH